MEILLSVIGVVLTVGACALRRLHKLRSYNAIRKMNARSDMRRDLKRSS